MKKPVVLSGALFALVLITGAMIYARQHSGATKAASYVNALFDVATPTPTFGKIALQNVDDIVKRVQTPTPESAEPAGEVRTLEGGLQVQDIVVGTGAEAVAGSRVTVHYTGWHITAGERGSLRQGGKFDSSRDRGNPFTLTLGQGEVIRGWDVGLVGMRAGGKRMLVIPPALAYGAQGAGETIAPNETLLFEVELLSVTAKTARP